MVRIWRRRMRRPPPSEPPRDSGRLDRRLMARSTGLSASDERTPIRAPRRWLGSRGSWSASLVALSRPPLGDISHLEVSGHGQHKLRGIWMSSRYRAQGSGEPDPDPSLVYELRSTASTSAARQPVDPRPRRCRGTRPSLSKRGTRGERFRSGMRQSSGSSGSCRPIGERLRTQKLKIYSCNRGTQRLW